MIIVFDTETTGLLSPEIVGLMQQPYLVELAAIKLGDYDFHQLDKLNLRFKPPIKIPDEAIKVHGITDADVENYGPFVQSLNQITMFFWRSLYLVGHNLMFDKYILNLELQRCGKHLQFPWAPHAVCTAEVSVQQFGVRYNLQDLHKQLFGEEFEGAHSASMDCEITAKCFVEMVNRRMIEV